MENIIDFLGHVDWIFAAVILIGGRYWGSKYFNPFRSAALNFLAFATAFGVVWAILKIIFNGGVNPVSLFITYLFVTSFYEVLAKKLFEKIEALVGSDKD